MNPKIDATEFGSITIAGEVYEHDVLITLAGKVKKRQKHLSREVYGTSHIVSLAEVQAIYEDGAERVIIGSGQSGKLRLSDQAAAFFAQKQCEVVLLPTPEALEAWNNASGRAIGMFHLTC